MSSGPFPLRLLAGVLFLTLASGTARALDPAKPARHYVHRVWHTGHGVPLALVRGMAQSPDGYLWLASQAGLVRFDGVRFVPVWKVDSGFWIRESALARGPDGAILFASDRSGVVRAVPGRLDKLVAPADVPHRYIRAVLAQGDAVWIGTAQGLHRVVGGSRTAFTLADGLPTTNVHVLAEGPDGTVWVGTSLGLARFRNGRFERAGGDSPAARGRVMALLSEPDGTVWAGLTGALVAIKGDTWRVYPVGADAPANVRAILRDRDGQLWVGADGRGLGRLRDDAISFLQIPGRALPTNVLALHEDREGNLWIGTEEEGLHCLGDGPVILTEPDGLGSGAVRAVQADAAGNVWTVSSGGLLSRYRDGRFSDAGAFPPGPRALAVGPDGSGVHVASSDGSVRRLDGETVTVVREAGDLVAAMLVDARGTLWMGGRGLERLEGGVLRPVPLGRAEASVTALHQGPGGAIWVSTDKGLERVRDEGGRVFAEPVERRGPALPPALALLEDAEGVLWMGAAAGGIVRWSNGQAAVFGPAQGLPADTVWGLVEDGIGRLWAAARGQIYWVQKRDLEAILRGRARTAEVVSFGSAEGFRLLGLTPAQPAATRGPDGRLWFATDGGVAVFPAGRASVQPATVLLEEVTVDGRPVESGPAVATFPPTRGLLEATFTAPLLAAPEKMRFRYRLDGLDEDWVSAGNVRRARYASLPPGHYRLRVSARSADGLWSKHEAEVAFVIQPPFHRTGWFAGLVVAALALAGMAGHRLRLRQIAARHAAVLDERARIAREMHDTLAQSFTAIALQLECAAEELPPQAASARGHLDEARSTVKTGLAEARRAIWALRPAGLDKGDLARALETIAGQMAAGRTIEVHVHGTPRPIPGSVEDNLLRIGQEALANALRHGHARRVDVTLEYARGVVRLRIKDDGTGFVVETAGSDGEPHQGLRGMEERVASLSGRLTVDSGAAGTDVRVEVPA